MSIVKRLLSNVRAFVAWLISCGLALIVIAIGAPLLQAFLVITLGVNQYSIRFWTQLYYVVLGMLWLGFFILMEHLMFSDSSREGLLLPRTLYVVGVELLVMAVLQFGLMAYRPFDGWVLFLTVGSALAGAALIWVARRKPPM
jgi:hypothetical protein